MSDYASEVRWWPGRGHSIPAEVVAKEIIALREQFGAASPAKFVDRARPDDSPIHELFEWDDAVAGEQHRIAQARQIISSFRVTYHDIEKVSPAFVSVRVDTPQGVTRGYVETARALADEQMREQVGIEALRALRAWRRRYDLLPELANLFAAIDRELPKAVGRVRRQGRQDGRRAA